MTSEEVIRELEDKLLATPISPHWQRQVFTVKSFLLGEGQPATWIVLPLPDHQTGWILYTEMLASSPLILRMTQWRATVTRIRAFIFRGEDATKLAQRWGLQPASAESPMVWLREVVPALSLHAPDGYIKPLPPRQKQDAPERNKPVGDNQIRPEVIRFLDSLPSLGRPEQVQATFDLLRLCTNLDIKYVAQRTGAGAKVRALADQPVGASLVISRQTPGSLYSSATAYGIRIKTKVISHSEMRITRVA